MRLIVKKYEAILFAAVVIAAVLTVSDVRRTEGVSGYSDVGLQPSDSARPFGGMVALTFDDGPHLGYTASLVGALKKYGVDATFYLVGKQIEKHPELAADLAESGFEIGGHTYSHDNLVSLDDSRVIYELEKTRLLLKSYASVEAYTFRPPGGRYDDRVRRIAEGMGYKMVLWDVIPKDHENISSDTVALRVIQGVKANRGGIVLLHSGRTPTTEALNIIIPALRSEGFEFVTISRYYQSITKKDGL
ncbi:MAG: polysaccharide deacetylase family protein [Endomicrobiia bacterium]|nr:polysaccharide deacetylase family protein [Endomicrobiia bacterium]